MIDWYYFPFGGQKRIPYVVAAVITPDDEPL